ncbi:MAG: rod shape-determining protein MreD [Lachnospiraceae bacterium]|nr:rod shape-determining protein MreD [Lachnospiraceae bacterium]
MRRVLVAFATVLIAFLLQCTVFQYFSLGGIGPNIMVIVTASIGFMRNEKSGLLIGFFSGLLIDIFFGNIIGFYALLYMLIGYMNGTFSRIFYPEDLKLPLALIAVSDLSFGVLCYVFLFLLNGQFHFTYYLLHVIIPEAVYTMVIGIVIYPLLLVIHSYLDKLDRSDNELV